MQSMSLKNKKRSEGKVKELKGKWRKGENWSSLENCEEKMGIDREKQRLWPKWNENLLPDPLGNKAPHMGPPYPNLFHLIISLLPVPCWIPQDISGFVLICIRARDLGPLELGDVNKAGSAWEEGRRTQNCLEATAWCLQGVATGTTHPTSVCWRCVKCRAGNGQGKLEKQADV